MKQLVFSVAALLLSILSYAQAPITGTLAICPGGSTTLSDAIVTCVWTSGTPSVATVGAASGTVTAVSVGVATISYTASGSTVTALVTVNPTPAPIAGALAVCVSGTTTLTDATPGGMWSNPLTVYATIGSTTGVVTGRTTGTVMITYTAATGCHTTAILTINPLPSPISSSTGSFQLCSGSTMMVSSSPSGGTWSSSSPVASISSTGLVTGISAGMSTITYTLPTSCATTAIVTVNVTPAAITGPASVPVGGTGLYTDITAGGMWSSDHPLTVSINAMTGVATGNSPGTAVISYCITATGCCNSTGATASPGLVIEPVSNGRGTMSIFPNPTNGIMTLQWSDQTTGKVEVLITDITGREVFSSELNMYSAAGKAQLQLNGLTSGMYFMHVRTEKLNHTERVIIQ